MKNLLLLLALVLAASCSDNASNEEMLEKDEQTLKIAVQTEKVTAYKFCKIMLRASADPDSTSSKQHMFRPMILQSFRRLSQLDRSRQFSVAEYLALAKDYQALRSFTLETDEDNFPTLLESASFYYGGKMKTRLLAGKAKQKQETYEHALLSGLVLFSKDLGKEVALYECSQTEPDLLDDSEFKALILFHRGFLFCEKGLYYLSDKDLTTNIDWLEDDTKTSFPLTRTFFGWAKLNNNQTRTGLLAMNYLFRGFDRTMMGGEDNEADGVEDFESFLENMNGLGVDNELTWSVEAYVHIRNEEYDKAIKSLEKLKKSALLSADQKAIIQESIDYLKKKDAGETNAIYDKVFIGKIASEVMLDQLAQIDWEQFLKLQKIPYARQIMGTVNTFRKVTAQIERHTSGESLKDAADDVGEEAEGLIDKAKGWFE